MYKDKLFTRHIKVWRWNLIKQCLVTQTSWCCTESPKEKGKQGWLLIEGKQAISSRDIDKWAQNACSHKMFYNVWSNVWRCSNFIKDDQQGVQTGKSLVNKQCLIVFDRRTIFNLLTVHATYPVIRTMAHLLLRSQRVRGGGGYLFLYYFWPRNDLFCFLVGSNLWPATSQGNDSSSLHGGSDGRCSCVWLHFRSFWKKDLVLYQHWLSREYLLFCRRQTSFPGWKLDKPWIQGSKMMSQ